MLFMKTMMTNHNRVGLFTPKHTLNMYFNWETNFKNKLTKNKKDFEKYRKQFFYHSIVRELLCVMNTKYI